MATDVRETEWQFDALDFRPVLRWLDDPVAPGVAIEPGGTVSQVDLYLDTDDGRFHRAGYALRIRRRGRRVAGEATLKAIEPESARHDGLRTRRELSEPLARATPELLLAAVGPVGERVRAVAGRKPVRPLFEVRTRRRAYTVAADGLPPGELALDETAIHAAPGGRPTRLRRIEIEVPEPAVEALGAFVERLRAACGLQPAALTKYEAGLLSAGYRREGAETFGSTAIGPELSIASVGMAVLRRQLSVFVAREPGTRLGDDIEELHDMRVASRRLRAALALFADVLPAGADRYREELGWIGRELGAVRDLDVQLEQLDEWLGAVPEADREALAALRSLLEEQRAAARAAMLEALDSRRYQLLVEGFGRLLRAGRVRRTGPPSLPVRAVAPDLVESRFRAVRRAAGRIEPTSAPEAYHRLRIRCKRLRYALEFVGEVYPGRTRPLVRRLVALQDVLGLHQDADIAIDRLRRLAVERGDLRPETVFAMGEIAERYRRSMVELRGQFPAAWAKVRGKAWKAFRDELERQRPAPAPSPPATPEGDPAAP
jgi:triphosphatase